MKISIKPFVTAAVAISMTLLTANTTFLAYQAALTYMAPVVDMKPHCTANLMGVSCHFTNTSHDPVIGCVEAKVVNTRNALDLTAPIACTGTMPPLTSYSMTIPWGITSPKDICLGAGTLREFSWEHCEFRANPRFLPGEITGSPL